MLLRSDYLKNLLQEVNADPKIGKNENSDITLSYAPEVIVAGTKQYVLKFPLRCLFEQEEDYYVIKNELLDLIGTGQTEEEAKENFNEEFAFLFHRLTTAEDESLSDRLIQVQQLFLSLVKEVR
ncbi:hypothetical protein BH09BAC1_BH09BAC1_01710 [soil metagenome]